MTRLAAAMMAAGLAQGGPAYAEEQERELATMKVSAEQEKPVQQRTEIGRLTEYTPLAGTVVGREELETVRFVDSFHELIPRVPGISMSRNLRFTDGGKNYTENRIDGMRARNTGTYTFIDEVNAGDIERIEFIRGPGSVLSGSNAVGGTINVITRDVPAQPEYQAIGEAFGGGDFRAGFTAGAPISNDLGYFFNINRLDNDGWREHTKQEKDSFSTKLQYRPDASSKLKFRLEYIHDDYQSAGDLTEQQFNSDWRQAQPNTYYRTEVTYVTPSLHYLKMFGDAGELNVYAQQRSTDSTANSPGFGGGNASVINDVNSTENNVQLLYKHMFGPGKGAVTGGVDMMNTDSRTKKYTPTAGTFDFLRGTMTSDSIARESHVSPLLQYEVSPLDPLRLSFGVRQDSIEYKIDDQMDNRKDGEKKYGKLVKKFGALYELDKRNFLWLNVAEGFMGPGVGTLIGSGGTAPATPAAARAARYVPTNMDLKPEESLTREIGVRGQIGSLKYDTGYYETDFTNLIVQTTCATTERCYQRNENAASAHANGVETLLEYPINTYLDVGLTHTYARYAYDNYVSGGKDYSGKERYYTPRNHYNLRATLKPAPGWRVELEMDHIDSYYTNQMLNDSYQRPDVYNLRASYTGKTWGFWLHALNLLDTKVPERVTSNEVTRARTYTEGYFPLTIRAGVSYNF
jgi:outer membrane receptor protein involved in Fe transport